MKKLLFFGVMILVTSSILAQAKVNPIIKNYGSVFEVPFQEEKPDAKMDYKILVDITDAADKPDSLNAYLEAAATLMNLHAVGGVEQKNIHMVIVLHKMGTLSILNNEAYQQRFKTDNPNLPLITALSDAGAKFFVCGQTMIRMKKDKSNIAPEVKIATSALTTITTYDLRGYARINFK